MPSSIIIAIKNLKHNYVRKEKLLGKLCAVFCTKSFLAFLNSQDSVNVPE